MSNLVLHERTAREIDNFVAQPSHAVILAGAAGVGKKALATQLIESVLKIQAGKLSDYPYIQIILPIDGKAIGIDSIRELDHFLSLKVPTSKKISRAVIIQDAHQLTIEAQNALLKMLEEPPFGTLFILTVANLQTLLPTIRSRAQMIQVTPANIEALKNYFSNQGYSENDINQAFSITGGLPGLMSAILSEDQHPLSTATEYARDLLSKTQYERLNMVDELAKNKQLAIDVTFILKQMAHISLLRSSGNASEKWQSILKASYLASDELKLNGQPKLTLSKLMISL